MSEQPLRPKDRYDLFDKTKWATLDEICAVYGVTEHTFYQKAKKYLPAQLLYNWRKKIVRNGFHSFIYKKELVIEMFEKFPPWKTYKPLYSKGNAFSYVASVPSGFVSKREAMTILNATYIQIRCAIKHSPNPVEMVYAKVSTNSCTGKSAIPFYNLKHLEAAFNSYLSNCGNRGRKNKTSSTQGA